MGAAYKGIAFGVLVALGVGLLLLRTSKPAQSLSTYPPAYADGIHSNGNAAYSSETYGLSFRYSSDYVLEEHDKSASGGRAHHVITLVRKEDAPPHQEGEGPPSITIDIYQNDLDVQSAESWIRNTGASNFKLGDGSIRSATLGSVPALSYRWSGLYEGSTVVYANKRFVYAFSVTYLQVGDPIVQDFAALRESVHIASKEAALVLTQKDARVVAEKSCVKGGEVLGEGFFNEVTRTWWFDANLNATRPGCNPACVVNADTQEAEINWRCTGLLPSAQ